MYPPQGPGDTVVPRKTNRKDTRPRHGHCPICRFRVIEVRTWRHPEDSPPLTPKKKRKKRKGKIPTSTIGLANMYYACQSGDCHSLEQNHFTWPRTNPEAAGVG